MTNIGRLFRTVRHLRAEQIFWQLRYRIHSPNPSAPEGAASWRAPPFDWSDPITKPNARRAGRKFDFLNEEGDLVAIGWEAAGKSDLWSYNLHYFDWLSSAAASVDQQGSLDVMQDWIANCSQKTSVGWEPYPVSLRLVNWAKFAMIAGGLPSPILNSMAHQTESLVSRLEYHLLGNHLFANAKALVIIGLVVGHPLAPVWLKKGLSLLHREFDEQFLSDGGHFERSPMYQALMVEDLLDLVNFMRAYGHTGRILESVEFYVRKALQWLLAMSHPDGKPSFFNDSTGGVAPTAEEILQYAGRLGFKAGRAERSILLKESGYARLQTADAVLLADIASIGPSYQPGHGHADMLSCEFSLGNQRVIVNSGISEYGTGFERVRQRSTAAHSTIEVGSENSAEVWSGFRVGRRGEAQVEHFSDDTVIGSHNGYSFLREGLRHRRRWTLKDHTLEIADCLENRGNLSAVSRFHLHPSITASADGIILPDGRRLRISSDLSFSVESGTYHPAFGRSEKNEVLTIFWPDDVPSEVGFRLEWS